MNSRNPWIELPEEQPFVLEMDRKGIDAYNCSARDDFFIHTGLVPEPFVGNPQAPLLILLLNPGFSPADPTNHTIPEYRLRLTSAIQGRRSAHYHLEGGASGPGSEWWNRISRHLLNRFDREVVAQRLLAVQYFPYHSRRFAHASLRVPSQDFGFYLVAEAIQRKALIICVRGQRLWSNAVPQLINYRRFVPLKNPRNASLSPGNMQCFDEVVAVLGKG